MSKRRLVITAVTVEGLSQSEAARRYQVSQGWVSKLLTRWRREGEAAYAPRSRRPHRSPTATPAQTVDLVLELRQKLSEQGLDAGPHTIAWHLEHHHQVHLSVATISRICTRAGLVEPHPEKRPKSALRRFAAELPNETWQADFTHYQLTRRDSSGRSERVEVEILNILDDHSRYLIASVVTYRVTGPYVVVTFRNAFGEFGFPASTLTDNGMVFTTRFAGGRGGRNGLETLLAEHGIRQKNSSPNHPQTCGKIERFHQTLKKWLRAQPPASTLAELQTQLDAFRDHYNQQRPHRGIGRRTPAAAYTARPKASPSPDQSPSPHDRVRRDRLDTTGKVTLRHHGTLYKIGGGRAHARTPVLLLVHDLNIRIIHATTGELLRELVLDPTRTYQPQTPQNTESEP